jgi:hypothetical protein
LPVVENCTSPSRVIEFAETPNIKPPKRVHRLWVRNLPLRPSWPLRPPEAHARASAILIDEFDASNFECTATVYTMLLMISPVDASVGARQAPRRFQK